MRMQAFRELTGGNLAATAPAPEYRCLDDALSRSIERAVEALRREQSPEGYWSYEFEADCTIPAEYILMMHFMDEIDGAIESKIAVYIRSKQCEDGGWPLFPGGELDHSCTVKAYFALKLAGDSPDEPHMVRARAAILARGGAVNANVFTKIALALFSQIPWRGVPFIPVEIMLLPRWFPFHVSKVSYWSRTVMVPLFVLCTLKPSAANPRNVDIRELFITPPEEETNYFPVRSILNRIFLLLDRMGRGLHKLVPGFIRNRAIRRAENWIIDRLNGTDGLGAIFPAMVNAHEALATLGYSADHPCRVMTKEALRRLLVEKADYAYCQPCVSPVWDTGLACLALQEADERADHPSVLRGLDWLKPRQLLDEVGDWAERCPGVRGGGWPFQFGNDHYPDIDDTPVIAWSMLESGQDRYEESIERAAEWICGMQSKNGGYASFDVDNTYYYLNEIPFADHGALLDPPTSDVTGRCVAFLSKLDRERFRDTIDRSLAFLYREQEDDGSWFGRWGTNYIYGTWSVLVAMEMAGQSMRAPAIRRAVSWLQSVQRSDGGWGEDNHSYFDHGEAGRAAYSTAYQTAWALLGLMAAGEVRSTAVDRGVAYLKQQQMTDGLWDDDSFTCPGFPRVFYLKYHGYTRYFPLWALARYRRLLKQT
ncbi:MAG: squalene--hopene cyclase [Gammaproteobacteria bacterium]|nr:squalene--hopene cyclase [Gammaproteobacteria bacterium]MDX2460203.1 squalene--hopene cyclase [Gammaproteobacteria bacterium]